MINIVKGNEGFLEGVYKLYLRVREQFKEENKDIYQSNDYPTKNDFKRDLSNSNSTYVVLDDDEVIGFITSEDEDYFFNDCLHGNEEDKFFDKFDLSSYKGRFVGLSRLMIDPGYRHQDIATKLVGLMEEKYDGFMIILLVNHENIGAINFYNSLGYKNLGQYDFTFGIFYIYIKNKLK